MDLPKTPRNSLALCFLLCACGQPETQAELASKTSTIEHEQIIGDDALAETLSDAAKELMSINSEFDRELIPIADNVHVAAGYGASIFTFIEGDDGIILVDTGQLPGASAKALQAYREISEKPIAAIIFTHNHGDHVNGASAFLEDGANPQIWGRDNFGDETAAFRGAGIYINRKRGARQAGFRLPPEKRINNGIAPAVYPRGDSFNPANRFQLTHTFSGRKEVEISGIKLVLQQNSGETDDQIYVWYQDKKVAFAGDNFYKSWPNLYAIRGTPYRDVKAWINAIEALLILNADVLVAGHSRPIVGNEDVQKSLTTYRDGIKYVFDKTIEGINLGLGPDELVEFAKLPPELANERVLRPYYGNPEWAVRSIFTGYLGWFDGNPSNLFPLLPNEEAQKMVAMAGGNAAMIEKLQTAIDTADNQWACRLADYLLVVEPSNAEVMELKAVALDRLAEQNVTSLARNYYFTSAQELRARADKLQDNRQ